MIVQPLRRNGVPLGNFPPRIIFFDGLCVFCNRAVRWILERDRAGRFHFAALQGSTADRLRMLFPDSLPPGLSTLVYFDNSESPPLIALRSAAVIGILDAIGDRSLSLACLRALPRWLRDLGYRGFVALRYRVFGRLESCRQPDPQERERFLD